MITISTEPTSQFGRYYDVSTVLHIHSLLKTVNTMKTLSILSYVIGSILLIISCFTSGVAATWWFGGIAVVFLVGGCIFQFQANKGNPSSYLHRHY